MNLPPKHKVLVIRWFLRLIMWLVLSCSAWWWLGGAQYLLRVLTACASITMPNAIFDSVSSIAMVEGQAWKIVTSLDIVLTTRESVSALDGGQAVILINNNDLIHTLLGFPLLWALLMSTPGRWKKRIVVGTLILTALAFLGIASLIWALLTVLVNHNTSAILSWEPPLFSVHARPYPSWIFHLSSFTCYLLVLIAPIISPILIWVMLCRGEVKRLVIRLRTSPSVAL